MDISKIITTRSPKIKRKNSIKIEPKFRPNHPPILQILSNMPSSRFIKYLSHTNPRIQHQLIPIKSLLLTIYSKSKKLKNGLKRLIAASLRLKNYFYYHCHCLLPTTRDTESEQTTIWSLELRSLLLNSTLLLLTSTPVKELKRTSQPKIVFFTLEDTLLDKTLRINSSLTAVLHSKMDQKNKFGLKKG